MTQPPTNPENAHERRRRKTPWWEIVAVGVALALLIVNWFQGCQTKKSADAATKAADIADKTLHMNSRNAWLDERAWITPIAVEIPSLTTLNQPIKLIMKLENSGKTPAEKLGGHLSFLAYEKGQEDDLIHPRKEWSNTIEGGVLSPNSHITLNPLFAANHNSGQQIINTPDFLEHVKKGNVYLMVHGKFKYADAWKVDHWIQFCATIPSTESQQRACTEYNQIDHNEPKE